jgi:Zn-dependent peptidase ImmA (M78 family)
MSQAELAKDVQLDRTMIAKIETGARRVDALELVRFSQALDLPLDHFLRARPAVISRRTQQYEESASEAARQSYRLEATLFEWLRDVQQVRESGQLEVIDPLIYPSKVDGPEDARAAAQWLRRELKLGAEPIKTLMSVCQDAGQFVLVTDAAGEGASLVDDGLAVAVVSRISDSGRRRATAAHELGHLVLGDEYSTDLGVAASRDDREAAIDAFAAELLLPGSALTAQSPGGESRTREHLVRLAAIYRTSWSMAVRQALHVGAIDRELARRWRGANPTKAELMESVGWAPQPDLASVFVPPKYAHAVIQMWKGDLLTSARAVDMLHGQISLEDLPLGDDPEIAP